MFLIGDFQNANGRIYQIFQRLGYNTLDSHTMSVSLCRKPMGYHPHLSLPIKQDLHYETF